VMVLLCSAAILVWLMAGRAVQREEYKAASPCILEDQQGSCSVGCMHVNKDEHASDAICLSCSCLGFGLMAGRAAVLAWEEAKAANPCILGDHQGSYAYGGLKYETLSHPCSASFEVYSMSVYMRRSYLGFGLMAGRAAVLAWEEAKAANPCILGDHQGAYEYGGMKYELVAHPSGASFETCSMLVKMVLRQNQACGAPQVIKCAQSSVVLDTMTKNQNVSIFARRRTRSKLMTSLWRCIL